jgi:hypothetical protein
MTKEEHRESEKQIEVEANQQKRNLNIKYAMELNTYSKGDKITDHIGTVLIDEITVSNGFLGSMPCCVYYGLDLKKNGEPRNDKRRRGVYGHNVS